jgi:hypothetical protein
MQNPFPTTAPDHHEIWEILMRQDFAAFVANDWNRLAAHCLPQGFFILNAGGSAEPGEWRISFPNLEAYRQEWVRQATDFSLVELVTEDKLGFLFRVTRLDPIQIEEGFAVACKRFDGVTQTKSGGELRLKWQSLFWLRRAEGHWRIAGALGYLPYPMVPTQAPGQAGNPTPATFR